MRKDDIIKLEVPAKLAVKILNFSRGSVDVNNYYDSYIGGITIATFEEYDLLSKQIKVNRYSGKFEEDVKEYTVGDIEAIVGHKIKIIK